MRMKWPKGKARQTAMLRYCLARIENYTSDMEARGVREALEYALYAGWISRRVYFAAFMLAGKGGMPPSEPPSNVCLAAALMLVPSKREVPDILVRVMWPNGQALVYSRYEHKLPGCSAGVAISPREGRKPPHRRRNTAGTERPANGNGSTAALSICAAVFRARLGDD